MDFIVARGGKELGFAKEPSNIDFDLGDTNDFELTIACNDYSDKYAMGNLLYSPGTEWGGVIGDLKTDTAADTVKVLGDTWRGMLAKKVIEPPQDTAYLTVFGDLNSIVEEVIGDEFEGLISANTELAGVSVSYTFDRYTDMLTGLSKCLKSKNHRLSIKWSDEKGCVVIGAVPITDYSSNVELSQDMRVDFTARDNRRGINHLICLGTGELENRQVVHLYMQGDGTVGTKPYYTGINERTAVYDYSNAESMDDLIAGGEKRLLELADYKELAMSVEGTIAEIGDIVGGRDRTTGLYMSKPVTGKILRITGAKEDIEYKVGE